MSSGPTRPGPPLLTSSRPSGLGIAAAKEQLGRLHAKAMGEPEDVPEVRVALAALHAPDEAPVESGPLRQPLLAQTLSLSKLPQSPAERCEPGLHGIGLVLWGIGGHNVESSHDRASEARATPAHAKAAHT